MKQDDFKYRYIVKVLSSIGIAVLNMIIQFVLPRAFSIEEYGYYTYNLNVFTSIVTLANLSASNAFIAKYSKRNQEIGMIYFYLSFYGIVAIVLNVSVIFLYGIGAFSSTFAGQTLGIVMLGLETAIVLKLLTDCISIYDAVAISRFPAVLQILLKIIVSGAVIFGYLFGNLNLALFYIIQLSVTIVIVCILLYAIIKEQKKKYINYEKKFFKEYIKEFYIFCKPLVLATGVAQITVILMNWALMKWSGTTEQALFGAAWQLNTLVTYVFSPYAELSKREFAVAATSKNDLKNKVEQALKLMNWTTSYFAIFIAFASDWILTVVYGKQYSGAKNITIIIMFYTVYQAWGQITGAYMIATEKTKANAYISVIGQILTLLFVFLFQIPNFIWPNTLGSIGIALNYLLANVITTYISVLFVCKTLNISAMKTIIQQWCAMLFCTLTSIVIVFALNKIYVLDTFGACIVKTLFAGIIYTCAFIIIIYIRPTLLGISRDSMLNVLRGRKK